MRESPPSSRTKYKQPKKILRKEQPSSNAALFLHKFFPKT